MASEVESFTIDMIKGYRYVYKDIWLSFKYCIIAKMKKVKKGLLSRHHASAKPAEMYTV